MTNRFIIDYTGYSYKIIDANDDSCVYDDQTSDIKDICELLNKADEKIKELERKLFTEKFCHFDTIYGEYGSGNIEEDCKKELGVTYTEAQKIIKQWDDEQLI